MILINVSFIKNELKSTKSRWKKYLIKKGRRRGLKLDALSYDDRSQAVILYKEKPIISKVNNEDIGLINNQRYKITKLDYYVK